jgi:hypothetical protein
MRWRPIAVTSLSVNVLLLLVLGLGRVVGVGSAPVTDVPSDLPMKMTEAAVAEIVRSKLAMMEDQAAANDLAPSGKAAAVTQIVAAEPGKLHDIEPRAAGMETVGNAWVVRAEGTFVNSRGLKQRVWSSGYFIIDDANGDVVGMGMP